MARGRAYARRGRDPRKTGAASRESRPYSVSIRKILPFLLILFAFLAVCFPLTNTDIWWHLAAGREILAGGFLYADPFSAGSEGQPWTDVHWLFQVVVYGLHAIGGNLSLVLVKCALFALGAWLLLRCVEIEIGTRHRGLAVAWLAIVLAAGRTYVFARPEVVTLLFVAVFLFVLARYRQGGSARLLWWLPVVQVIWSNVQALYVLGPLILACALAGDGLSHLAARAGFRGFERAATHVSFSTLFRILLAVLAACLVSPYGFENLLLPLKLLSRIDPQAALFSVNVSENLPTWELARRGDAGAAAFGWISTITFASFLVTWRRIPLGRFLLVVALFATALMANRNMLLFFWVAGPAVLLNLGGALPDRPAVTRRGWLLQSPVVGVVAVLLLALPLGTSARGQGSLSGVAPFRVPVGATRLLAARPEGATVFCSVRYGGYLAWHLHPRWRPVIDGRLVIRTPQQFGDYLRVVDQPEQFDAYHARYDFGAVLLPAAAPDRYAGLIVYLAAHPDWRLVHTDGTEVLFLPAEGDSDALDLGAPRLVSGIRDRLVARFDAPVRDRAIIHLGILLARLGHPGMAGEVLRDLQDPRAQAVLAALEAEP